MSSEWFETTLGEFVRLQRGHDLTASEQNFGPYPVMGSAGQNGVHNVAKAKGPGVVIGRSGASMGRVHFSEVDYWPHNTCLYVTDFLGNNPRFAFYLLSTLDLAGFNSGSAQPSLNRNYIYGMPLKVPVRVEQDRIVKVLCALDDRITLLRETNATLEAIAQALFKSWFVDFDPVHANANARAQHQNSHPQAVQQNPAPHTAEANAQNLGLDAATAALFPDHFQDSDLGPIPAGWRVAPIKSACFKVESGGTPKRNISEYWNGEISWLSSGEIRNPIILETKEKISLLGVENSSAKIWPKDTTVVAMYGATAGEVCQLAIDSTANQACCALIPRENTAAFVFLNMRRDRAVLATKASGSAQQNLNKGLVESHLIVLPSDEVLSKFEEISGALIKGWVENEKQAQTLTQLRDTLLPRLISGQLRLPSVEAQIEAAVGGA